MLRRKGITLWSIPAVLMAVIAAVIWPLVSLRRAWRQPRVRIDRPVISVGNLAMGGSGKTPLVEFIARHLQTEGFRVGIVSSGWGRTNREMVIASGRDIVRRSASEVGDEVILLAEQLPMAQFAVAPVKAEAAQLLADKGDVDVVLVDDGFQHFRLHRDLDIATFDAALPARQQHLFPYGIFREPVMTLQHADIVILTRANMAKDIGRLERRLRRYVRRGTPIYKAHFLIDTFVTPDGERPVKYLEDKSALLFAGIGSFRALRKQVKKQVGTLVAYHEFPDHVIYTDQRLSTLRDHAADLGVEVIVTTGKDWTKVHHFDFGREIGYLDLTIDLDPGEEKLIDSLLDKLPLERPRV